MTKHMRGVHVAVPVRAILIVSLLVMPAFLNLFHTHSANALPLGADKLLDKITQPVIQLLPSNSSPPSQPRSESTKSNSSSGNASSQSGSNQASSTASPVVYGDAAAAGSEASDMQPLEPLAPIDTSDIHQPLLPLVYLANARPATSNQSVLAQASTIAELPIQASEEGWRLFGVAWYWWLAATGALAFGIRYLLLSGRFSPLYSSAGQ